MPELRNRGNAAHWDGSFEGVPEIGDQPIRAEIFYSEPENGYSNLYPWPPIYLFLNLYRDGVRYTIYRISTRLTRL